MREFLHKGRKLEYIVRGQGTPLVFLHGLGGSVQQILQAYDPLEQVQLIALNQQGHGNSEADWKTYGFQEMADDVMALLDVLGIPKAVFAGISMGAAVCLNGAVRYPRRVKSLLLIRNAWTDQPMSQKVQKAYGDLGKALRQGGVEAFQKMEGWQIVRESSDYTRSAFLGAFLDPSNQKNWQKYEILPACTPISSLDELGTLFLPVHILANRNDLCYPFSYGERLYQAIPGSRFTEIPDKDRNPKEHREQMNRAIREMINTNTC